MGLPTSSTDESAVSDAMVAVWQALGRRTRTIDMAEQETPENAPPRATVSHRGYGDVARVGCLAKTYYPLP